ncbi:hypothetical protein SCHPADRAFT_74447 [Schizopora paradoxa]|uniref:Uncharacterized protein n=1 Tax=Schizopora paradoxa TaxID=27342 RepID=A0A0H2SQK8_9AGAM|nr:hypothetical protein SCHPADRAFT_74447 [Schizopora paradoxa]
MNREARGGPSVFKRVEESHSALYELDDERLEKDKRSIGQTHYAPTTTTAKYLLLTPIFLGDVLYPTITAKDISTTDETVIDDRKENKITINEWYLPVRFVAALALNKVEWDKVLSGAEPGEKKSVGAVDDEDFIGEWEDEWCAINPDPRRAEQFTKSIVYVPLRARNGTLQALRCKLGYKDVASAREFKKTWANSLETLLKVTSSSGSFRKFNRSVDVPLAHGLRFHILGAAITRFDTKDEARKALDDGITLIKGLKKPCAISADDLTQAVVEDKPNNEWMKLSTNPFGLYSTYVHRDDWKLYMQGLGPVKPGMTPIRRFRADASDELEAMTNKILAERPTADPNQIVALNNQNVPLERSQTAMTDASAIEEEGSERETSLGKAQRTFVVPLSNAKRQASVGQRKFADDQNAVMGGYTAPQIAHSLGWSWERDPPDPSKPSYQMPNSLYIAEVSTII